MTDAERIRGIEDRISRFEGRVQKLETAHAVSENSRGYMDARFDKLEKKIDWVGKVVAAAVLAAVVNFVLNGGLHIAE